MDRDRARMKHTEGMTIIEVIISMAILATLILALLSMLTSASRLDAVTRERTVALNALREVAETLRAYDFGDLYDAYGATGVYSPDFTIPELQGASVAPVGSITFLVDETDKSPDSLQFNFPRDLNGDGNALNVDVGASGDYVLLPVKLNATWDGLTGRQSMNLFLMLADQ